MSANANHIDIMNNPFLTENSPDRLISETPDVEEAVCRICRCEGTPDDPLFHPCKCRGSIKYIHQDCLTAWLQHSNKKTCDICKTPFAFKTVYDENTPDVVPFKIVLRRLLTKFFRVMLRAVIVITTAIILTVEFPLFVSAMFRLDNWLLGVPLPSTAGIVKSLLFGTDDFDKDSFFTSKNLEIIAINSYASGWAILLSLAIIGLSIGVIHSSVVSDDGLVKIIHKRIGPEPRMNRLFQALNQNIQDNNNNNNNNNQNNNDDNNNDDNNNNNQHNNINPVNRNDEIDPQPDVNANRLAVGEHRVDIIINPNPVRHDPLDAANLNNEALEEEDRQDNHVPHPDNNNNNNNQEELERAQQVQNRWLETERLARQLDEIENFVNNVQPVNNDGNNAPDPDIQQQAHQAAEEDIPIIQHQEPQGIAAQQQAINNDLNEAIDNIELNGERIRERMELLWDEVERVNGRREQEAIGRNDQARLLQIRRERELLHQFRRQNADIQVADNANNNNINNIPNAVPLAQAAVAAGNMFGEVPIADDNNNLPIDPARQQRQRQRDDGNFIEEELWKIVLAIHLAAFLVLFAVYFLPSLLGILFTNVVTGIVKLVGDIIDAVINSTSLQFLAVSLNNWYVKNAPDYRIDSQFITDFLHLMNVEFIAPFVEIYDNTISWTPKADLFERLVTMSTGYTFIGFGVFVIMYVLESGCSQNYPLTGAYRSIYVPLLETVCTLKVLCLFAIEWLFFPVYCGYLLRFCLIPIIGDNPYAILMTPFDHSDSTNASGFFSNMLTWILGTFFMYHFASFVGMIRANILRKGVLFFIRPSDDPNLRLVHDALMKPFGLKLSRIALSALVYTMYILVEFALPAWAVRYLSPVEILPETSRIPNMTTPLTTLSAYLRKSFSEDMSFIWKRVFKFVASQLRLSSFLLSNDKASERGHVVYRSWYHYLFCFEKPDYSSPVADFKTKDFFKEHPGSNSCFVPDGSYVRAPDDDQVARRFVKQLFVPVTKSDQLLAPIPPLDDKEEKRFNPYDDEEPMEVTTYTIVYRPPHFQKRIWGMLSYLWFFSMLFTFLVYLASITVGRFVYGSIFRLMFAGIPGAVEDAYLFDSPYKLDLGNMICGLFCIKYGYKFMNLLYANLFTEDGTMDRLITTIKGKVASKLSLILPKLRRTVASVFPFIRDGLMLLYSCYCTIQIIINCIVGPISTIQHELILHHPTQKIPIKIVTHTFGITFGIVNCIYLWGGPVNNRNNVPFRKFPRYVVLATVIILGTYCYITGKPLSSLPGIYSSAFFYTIEYIEYKDFNFNNVVFMVLWFAYIFSHVSHSVKNYLANVSVEMKEEIYGSGRVLTNMD